MASSFQVSMYCDRVISPLDAHKEDAQSRHIKIEAILYMMKERFES